MSKIVCDVCGSSYSETEAQCPICGTAKSEAVKPVVETTMDEPTPKGGKFSKETKKNTATRQTEKNASPEPTNNIAMIAIVAVLLLAIVAVCVFIFLRATDKPDPTEPSDQITTSSTQPPVVDVPCTGIELVGNDSKSLTFNALTESAQLNVKALPEDTTDSVICTYTSSDKSVVTVSATGLVTPVGSGKATITIAYREYTVTVDVACEFLTKLTLTTEDVTLSPTNGLTSKIYTGELADKITWTSSNEAVAIVEEGVVTAVSNGDVTITATYGDLKATCKVHVKEMGKETEYILTSTWGDKSDATLTVGEKMEIWLTNKATGEVIKDLTWTPSNDFPKCCTMETTEKGIKITATAVTTNISGAHVYVKTVYEGETYKFIIRVKAGATQE